MSKFNTNNPLGSSDPRDFHDNAINIDTAVNGSGDTWVDRLGTTRKTLTSIEQDMQEQTLIATEAAQQASLSASQAQSSNVASDSARIASEAARDASEGFRDQASTFASNASGSASTASTAATTASTSAAQASTSATNAASSATSAAQSASMAAEIAVGDVRNYFGLDFQPSIPPSLSLNFDRQEHAVIDEGILTGMPLQDIVQVTNGAATRVDHRGLIVPTAPNTARIDWTGGRPKLLVEEQRTNLTRESSNFAISPWVRDVLDVTLEPSTEISPIEGSTATKIIKTGGTFRSVRQTITSSASVHTLSVYAKKGSFDRFSGAIFINDTNNGARCVFSLTTKTVDAAPIGSTIPTNAISMSYVDVGNDWTRCILTVDSSSITTRTSVLAYIYAGVHGSSDVGDFHIDGAQLEAASTPSSYIPTQASAVTRIADNVSRVLGSEWNSQEGTLYAEFRVPPRTNPLRDQVIFGFSPQTLERFMIEFSAAGRIRARNIENSNGVQDVFVNLSNVDEFVGQIVKVAFSNNGSEISASINGQPVVKNTIRRIAQGNEIFIGRRGGVERAQNLDMKNARYFPKALSDSELIELTKV